MSPCPVCHSSRIVATICREKLPVFQNVVWPTMEAAISAPVAPFVLGTCEDCGFSFNAAFDPALATYDARYDNSVPALAYRDHCRSIADLLVERLGLEEGRVYEIGCGKGEFLEALCAAHPGMQGIGIDPSCAPAERGNVRLIRAELGPDHRDPGARAVIVRHVLEHIADPVAFMAMIRGCFPAAPVYVEVPDLGWILDNGAFWDFCYEHCNYFTPTSLATCLSASGYSVTEQELTFGDQYQWAIIHHGQTIEPKAGQGADTVRAVLAYSEIEAEQFDRIRAIARARGGIVPWGMATKGVILCSILGRHAVLGGIDANPAKQGLYAAGSGVEIHPPSWARDLPKGSAALIMNPNYAGEIADTVLSMGADIELLVA